MRIPYYVATYTYVRTYINSQLSIIGLFKTTFLNSKCLLAIGLSLMCQGELLDEILARIILKLLDAEKNNFRILGYL